MAQMNLILFENVLDDFYGKVGTPERDDTSTKSKRLYTLTVSVKP